MLFLGDKTMKIPWVEVILSLSENKIERKQMCKKILIFTVLLVLSACSLFGSYYEPEAVGIGKDVNELKLSPCACMQLDLIKNVPDWFWEAI